VKGQGRNGVPRPHAGQGFQKLSYYSLQMAFSYAWSLRSCNKDSGHTIWSAEVKNPTIHAKLMAHTFFIELELWEIKVLHCRNKDFRLFCSCYLDTNQISFTYELDPYSLEIHWMCKYELPTSRNPTFCNFLTHMLYKNSY